MDPMAGWHLEHTYAALPPLFHAPATPTTVREPRMVVFNRPLATELGLDADALDGAEGAAFFAGNANPDGARPIAQAYAGRQFGYFWGLDERSSAAVRHQVTATSVKARAFADLHLAPRRQPQPSMAGVQRSFRRGDAVVDRQNRPAFAARLRMLTRVAAATSASARCSGRRRTEIARPCRRWRTTRWTDTIPSSRRRRIVISRCSTRSSNGRRA
jgi:hypothetical protein